MNEPLKVYHDILFLALRPWKLDKYSDLKLKELLNDLKKEYYISSPLYELSFEKPLSPFRKYYNSLIDYEAIKFLNEFHENITTADDVNEQKYLLHFIINKVLLQKLKETAQIISERNYSEEQYNLKLQNKSVEKSIANQAYVIYNLKYQLIRLIVELQDRYSDYLTKEALSLEEIHYEYFNEEPSTPSYINEAVNYPETSKLVSIPSKEEAIIFNPIRNDIRTDKKGIFSYEQLIKNPSRFADFESKLFENGLIDEDYSFKDEYGQKKTLAAIYHQLIRKSYFNKRIFPENIENTDLIIRKFLDYRYSANVDKQFRNWANTQTSLLSFIEKDYWLDNIPSC